MSVSMGLACGIKRLLVESADVVGRVSLYARHLAFVIVGNSD